jgi:hypothetical protein
LPSTPFNIFSHTIFASPFWPPATTSLVKWSSNTLATCSGLKFNVLLFTTTFVVVVVFVFGSVAIVVTAFSNLSSLDSSFAMYSFFSWIFSSRTFRSF